MLLKFIPTKLRGIQERFLIMVALLRHRPRVEVLVLGHAQNSDNATKVSNILKNM